eukprot:scaffold140274_cov31-Prasinocladus_malaysianus.AAC.1
MESQALLLKSNEVDSNTSSMQKPGKQQLKSFALHSILQIGNQNSDVQANNPDHGSIAHLACCTPPTRLERLRFSSSLQKCRTASNASPLQATPSLALLGHP